MKPFADTRLKAVHDHGMSRSPSKTRSPAKARRDSHPPHKPGHTGGPQTSLPPISGWWRHPAHRLRQAARKPRGRDRTAAHARLDRYRPLPDTDFPQPLPQRGGRARSGSESPLRPRLSSGAVIGPSTLRTRRFGFRSDPFLPALFADQSHACLLSVSRCTAWRFPVNLRPAARARSPE